MSTTTSMIVSDQQIDEFHTQGFTIFRGLFSAEEVAELAAGCDELRRRAAEALGDRPEDDERWNTARDGARLTFNRDQIRHIAWAGALAEPFRRYGEDPRLLVIAKALLGSSRMAHLINQVHFKEPGGGVKFDWHQDCAHRGIFNGGWQDVNGKGSYVQTAIAIDQVTMDNGPLAMIPGSNQRGALLHEGGALIDPVDDSTQVFALLAPGDVAAFGPYTIHGSSPNVSSHARRTFLNGFASPGANQRRYTGHEHGAGQEFDADERLG